MPYFALIYDVVDDYVTRRTQFREEHLRLANDANTRGELILGGAFSDPADQTLLIFSVHDVSVVEKFVANDPYYRNGLVRQYKIRPWNVVIGNEKRSG